MTIPILATLIRALWLVIEYLYLRRHRVSPAKDWDRHSAKLWDIANAIEPVGLAFGFAGIGRIQTGSNLIAVSGLALLSAGVAFRWIAIYSLGKFFTGTVLIKDDHRLVRTGLYRHLRHPAYTGALVAHLGLGLSFSNWFTLSLSVLPFVVAAAYRMHVEERALREAFGDEYIAYSRSTKRLIPKVY
ncbi:MAG: isoprenylcysteine carboxylmethyltransferase family protein [Acidobacteriota bacterium]|nr:isoprenylcysteine carboxylmethyltransferase family protein [Acidobacteriota bacterium]